MKLKRNLARMQVKYRKLSRKRTAAKEKMLMLERNKALHEAEAAAKKAKLLEDKRQAQAKKLEAEERLRIAKGKKRKALRSSAKKTARGTIKTLGKVAKGLQKWSRSRGY